MKLPCAVTRDLLPLYAENMVEQETKVLIEEHLNECEDCKKKLSELNVPAENPVDTAKPLQNLKKQIRLKRFFAAALAALCVFVCVYTYFYRTTTRMDFLPWQDGLIRSVELKAVNPDEYFVGTAPAADSETAAPARTDTAASDQQSVDALVLQVSGFVNGIEEQAVADDNGTTMLIQMFGTNPRSDHQITSCNEYTICPAPDRLIYGYTQPQKLLWGDPMDGGVEVLPRLALAYYLIIAAGLTVLTGLVWFFFRKWNYSWVLRQLFFAPAAYILSHLLLKGTKATSFFMEREFLSILLVALAIYALLSIAWQIYLRGDRGRSRTR